VTDGGVCDAGSAAPWSREDAADYVAAMSRDLSAIARCNGLATLAYLLDMASLEAADRAACASQSQGSASRSATIPPARRSRRPARSSSSSTT
jgi:hypothetical protein